MYQFICSLVITQCVRKMTLRVRELTLCVNSALTPWLKRGGCGADWLTQDHITPLSEGGNHTLSNIVPACLSVIPKSMPAHHLCLSNPCF